MLILLLLASTCRVPAEEVDNAAMVYASSQEKMRTGQSRDGIQQLYGLVRSSQWFAQAHWAIGQAEDTRGNYIGAYVAYTRYRRLSAHADDKKAIRQRLDELQVKVPALGHFANAEAHAHAKQWGEAIAIAQTVIDEKPKFALSFRLLGIAHASLGNTDAAADAYTRYLEIDPDAPERIEIEEFLADYRATAKRKVAP